MDGAKALKLIESNHYDLATLDLMLPHVDGLRLCANIRKRYKDSLILGISALDTMERKEKAYNLGADDYIDKPFSPKLLAVKIEALLKRRTEITNVPLATLKDLQYDENLKQFFIHGKRLALTFSEYIILKILFDTPKKVFSKEESISKLKNSNAQLNNMIMSLSHDIKTPLTIIEGYLEELEDGIVLKENTPKVIAILKKETAYINELSSEVIHYLQSLENTSNKVTISLKYFLDEEVCPLIRVKDDVELKCEVKDDFNMLFDRIALKSILVNLLHNASKHTQSGTITIKSSKGSIIVEDTGVGISSEYAENIFEPFVCLDKSKNREKSGFGLGLSIARNLALVNGYSLILDTDYISGSRFILKI